MRIKEVIQGKIYRVEMDYGFLASYRRIEFSKGGVEWEHLVDEREKLWIPVSETVASDLEEAYRVWMGEKRR